jgi:hypothetical protein
MLPVDMLDVLSTMWLGMTLLGLSVSHPGLGLLAFLRRDELDWYMYSGANSTRSGTLRCVYNASV